MFYAYEDNDADMIFKYTNKQALADGQFIDVTPRTLVGFWTWLVTPDVREGFSPDTFAELFNELLATGSELHRSFTVNDVTLWAFVEHDDELGYVFKVIFPSEY